MHNERDVVQPQQPERFGTIVRINGLLFVAALNVAIARFMWPTDPKWWGLGFLAIILCFAALGFVVDALKLMAGLYGQAKTIKAYRRLGKHPKSARLADEDDQIKAGMK